MAGYIPANKRIQINDQVSSTGTPPPKDKPSTMEEDAKEETSSDENGLVKDQKPKKKAHKAILCQRCYNIQHYGRLSPLDISPETFRTQVNQSQTETLF